MHRCGETRNHRGVEGVPGSDWKKGSKNVQFISRWDLLTWITCQLDKVKEKGKAAEYRHGDVLRDRYTLIVEGIYV